MITWSGFNSINDGVVRGVLLLTQPFDEGRPLRLILDEFDDGLRSSSWRP